MESESRLVRIASSSDTPENGIASWLVSQTVNSSVILATFWKTAGEAYDLQDSFFKDSSASIPFWPARITTAGLDELSRGESDSASAIASFKELGGNESHTLNIIHEYRVRRNERGDMSLVGKWNYAEQSLSVQEAVYAFEGRSVTVLACRAKPKWPKMLSDPECLKMILDYCHALRSEDVLVVYGLQGLQRRKCLKPLKYEALELPSGGLVLYHDRTRSPPTIEDGMVNLLCKRIEPLKLPQMPSAVIFTFNIQNPYTHEFDVLKGKEGEKLSLGEYTTDERIKPYVDDNSKILAGHIISQTLSALPRCSQVVWAIQEASDEFVLAMQEKAQADRLPLRLYNQLAARDDCLLVFSREQGIEVVATLDIGLDDTRAETENYDWSQQPPLMTLSMLREGLIVHLAACHLYVPIEEKGRTRRTTVVQDVLLHWHLPQPPPGNQYDEAIVVLGDFNLKENFWWQRWDEDGTSLEEPHGTAAFKKHVWVTLGEKHKLSEQDELTSPNDHIFVYTREGDDDRALKVADVTSQYRAAFKEEKAMTDGALSALSRAFFQRPDQRSLDETEVQTWSVSDHAPLAVSISSRRGTAVSISAEPSRRARAAG